MKLGPALIIIGLFLVYSIIFIKRYRTNIANAKPNSLAYISLFILTIVCVVLYRRIESGIMGALIITSPLLFFWLSILSEGIHEDGFYIYFRPLPFGKLPFKDVSQVILSHEEKGLLLEIHGKGYEMKQLYPKEKEAEIKNVLNKNAILIKEY